MDMKQCCVKLTVQPSRGLMDEKFVVLVQNVPPGLQLTIHTSHQCEDGHSWEAFGHYNAEATGHVNVSEDPSLGGTYSGVEAMGLLWSLRPVPGSKPGLRMRRMNVQTPMEVTVSVYQGHQTEGLVDQVPLAGVTLTPNPAPVKNTGTILFVTEHMGRLQCPLLVAYESAMDMKEVMERAGNGHLLTYPNAGHLIEPPYTPHHAESALLKAAGAKQSTMALWGGETLAHSGAQEDAWRKTLVFLREHLYGSRNLVF